MYGNVAESCADAYAADYYAESPLDDPAGPLKAAARVIRGGSWHHPASACRPAARFSANPDERSSHVGFRVLLETNAFPECVATVATPAALAERPQLRFLAWQDDYSRNPPRGVFHADGSVVNEASELRLLSFVDPPRCDASDTTEGKRNPRFPAPLVLASAP